MGALKPHGKAARATVAVFLTHHGIMWQCAVPSHMSLTAFSALVFGQQE